MYLCLLRADIILCWIVDVFDLFACLLRTIEIIMFGLLCMFAEN
jgi:hypothetical protein